MCPSGAAATTSQRPICTICYEDLKTIAEDLQVIPNCGHVFHELCLQQWLEYCPAGKRPTCPFCKQPCVRSSPTRLYFQSTGDPTQISSSPNRHSSGPDAEELAEEVRKLEAKLSSLTSNFENQQTHLKKLNDELSAWKNLAKSEEAKKEDLKKNKDLAEQLLQMKMEELSRKSSECLRLEQRSLGLAKELATLKLATDLNLGEEEIMKLASLGHGGKPENAVAVLRKSLALRNKSYKELMARCNLLGREGNRTTEKLDKAKEKIKRLQTRVQEVEKILEEKENGILRDLKSSYKRKVESTNISCARQKLAVSGFKSHLMEDKTGIQEVDWTVEEKDNATLKNLNAVYKMKSEGANSGYATGKSVEASATYEIQMSKNQTCHSNRNEDHATEFPKDITSSNKNNCVDPETGSHSFSDDDAFEPTPNLYRPRSTFSTWQNKFEFQKNKESLKTSIPQHGHASFPTSEVVSMHGHVSHTGGSWSLDNGAKDFKKADTEEFLVRNMKHISSETQAAEKLSIDLKQATAVSIRKEAQIHNSAAYTGDLCLPGRFLGEGTDRRLDNWGIHSHTKPSLFRMPTMTNNDSLIAVGADGRGGRVKVLRHHDRPLDGKPRSGLPKRQKQELKQSGQSQIEHFFGRTES